MTTKHTPGPWQLRGPRLVTDNHDAVIAERIGANYPGTPEGNAARIVQCVNACEGMTDPAAEIAALREALQACKYWLNFYRPLGSPDAEYAVEKARAALGA